MSFLKMALPSSMSMVLHRSKEFPISYFVTFEVSDTIAISGISEHYIKLVIVEAPTVAPLKSNGDSNSDNDHGNKNDNNN